MKAFKKLDKTTKIGLLIAIVFILPLLISITVKVLNTSNIIF
tara:strand:- start:602 stop:727 length:126 start_codon:yes stop_codon:yes gene_type:complete